MAEEEETKNEEKYDIVYRVEKKLLTKKQIIFYTVLDT